MFSVISTGDPKMGSSSLWQDTLRVVETERQEFGAELIALTEEGAHIRLCSVYTYKEIRLSRSRITKSIFSPD
jgi:hypothetical protein